MKKLSCWVCVVLTVMLLFFGLTSRSQAQTKVGYVASHIIRERFPEAMQANQRIETIVSEWKKEMDERQKVIDQLQTDIIKNRLIWGDTERKEKEDLFEKMKRDREDFAKKKFGPDGAYDSTVSMILRPIENKIYAAIQEVASSENYDIIWDKSTQPLLFVSPRFDITIKVMEKLYIPVDDLKEKQKDLLEKERLKIQPEEARRRPRTRPDAGDEKPKTDPAKEPIKDPKSLEIPR